MPIQFIKNNTECQVEKSKHNEGVRMKTINRAFYSMRIVFKYALGWSFVYIAVMAVSALLTPARLYLIETLVDSLGSNNNGGLIALYIVLILLSIVMNNLFSLANGFIRAKMNEAMLKNQLPITLKKFRRIDYCCFENRVNQDMLQKISENPTSSALQVFYTLASVLYAWISTIGILVMFFRATFILGIVSIATMIPMFIFESLAASKEMKLRWTMTTDIRKRYYLQQLFVDKDALQEIKLFDSRKRLIELSNELTGRINADMKRTLNRVIALSTASSLFLIAFVGFSLIWLSYSLANVAITLGVFSSLITSLTTFYGNVKSSVSTVATLQRLSYNIEYYRQFMALPERCSSNSKSHFEGREICFSNVSFTYPEGDKEVLHNVSFTIRKGDKVAFVGENGAGKSTVIKLLLGLYKPTSGKILIDGIESSELSDEQYQELFSVVFQDYQNYSLTLRENVAFGNIEKINDDASIEGALNKAEAKELIDTSKDGLEQHLGRIYDDGRDLSGGQWQKIALSRAYLAETPFLILDEPTAALDPIAESKMYSRFANVLSDRGAIMISHRLASARMADRIYVFHEGSLIETGEHNELIHFNGLYRDMWEKQSSLYLNQEVQ